MEITEITTKDIEEFAELYTLTFNHPPWSEDWSLESAIARLTCYRNTPNFIGVSAYSPDRLAGFIFGNCEPYQDNALYLLKEMCVHPEHQRSGVGTELLQSLHSILARKDISTVNLLTRSGGTAESFYLKNGYYKSSTMGLYVARFCT